MAKRNKRRSFLTNGLAIGIVFSLLMAGSVMSQNKNWEVEGVMSDACQCFVFCPCEFNSKPSLGHCDDAAILHIEKGHYGDVILDGQRVAVVSQSPHGERLVDAVGNLTFARIYVPEGATDAQTTALAEIVRRVFGTFVKNASRISADEKVEKVKMDVTIEPYHHQIRIPNILDLDLATVPGGDGKSPMVIQNHIYTAVGFGDVLISQSKVYKYKNKAKRINWNYSGRSASIRTFKLKGES
jgi:hypothetical protein